MEHRLNCWSSTRPRRSAQREGALPNNALHLTMARPQKRRAALRRPVTSRGVIDSPAAVDRQSDDERRADAGFGLERERAALLLENDVARDRETLTGALPDLFRGEERIEDAIAHGI